MKRGLFLIALFAGVSLYCRPGAAESMRDPCEAPDEVAGVIAPLPHVASVLKPGSALEVLAVGSASVFGPEAKLAPGALTSPAVSGAATSTNMPGAQASASPNESGFPQQMAKALEAAVPGLKVKVTVRGGRGLSAADQLSLLEDLLDHGRYQLVIWQTGTVEAVRNTPPAEFGQTLVDGAARIERAGADLVLIDPQFSRFLQTNSNLEPYEQAFQHLGSMPGVLLFHRFDLMRAWVNEGQIDLERTPKIDRRRVVKQLHACLGAHLARMVLSGARA